MTKSKKNDSSKKNEFKWTLPRFESCLRKSFPKITLCIKPNMNETKMGPMTRLIPLIHLIKYFLLKITETTKYVNYVLSSFELFEICEKMNTGSNIENGF